MANVSDYLFHYCSANTLLSIVTKREVWASDIRFMNDRFEGQLLFNKLQELAQNPALIWGPQHSIASKHLDALNLSLSHGMLARATCFSKQASSLPMFRMYGPGSGGYAIGFERSMLSNLGAVIDCNYSESDLLEWCKNYILDFCESAKRLDRSSINSEELKTRIVGETDLLDRRIQASWRFKHPDFNYEGEVRLMPFADIVAHRVSTEGHAIIPFSAMLIPNESSVSVWLTSGPNRDSEFAYATLGEVPRIAQQVGTKWNFFQAWNSFSSRLRA